MSGQEDDGSVRGIAKQGEEALGKLAQELLSNPMVSGALTSAFNARHKAAAAQEVAMGALNLPSAADIERLTRRVRSLSQRLEGIEDGVDRLDDRLAKVGNATVEARLEAIEQQLTELGRQLTELAGRLPGSTEPVPRDQERLSVPE